MHRYTPPHDETDTSKLLAMVNAIRRGERLPPIVVEPNGLVAITGSHRLAAWAVTGLDPDALVLSEQDYLAAVDRLGGYPLAWESADHESRCRAIYETTTDATIRAALKDQI